MPCAARHDGASVLMKDAASAARFTWFICRTRQVGLRAQAEGPTARFRWGPESHQDLLYHLATYIRQTEMPALVLEGQARMIDPESVQNGGVQVVHMHGILSNVVRIVVRFADREPRFDARSSHPN